MRVKSFDNHKIIKLLLPTVTGFISRQKPDKITSQPSEKERFLIEIFIGISKITDCLDQIYFSIEMLSGFRKKKGNEMNRHDYIIFMIENFFLRITSIFDRTLHLTNFLFDIGIPERECKESTIIKNNKIKGTEVEKSLKDLKRFTDRFKPIRNKVAHSNAFEDKELYPIRDYYYLIDKGDPDNLRRFSHVYKTKTDKYIKDKKIELEKSADEVLILISNYFESITPYIEKKIN